MTHAADVVVVGGGIAGASLACALAREGLGITVLEATVEYEDRVRGESMQAWGVNEARLLGVEDVLLRAGAHVAPLWKQYTEGAAEPDDIPMSIMVPGVDGALNLRHPDACLALADAAAGAGATVVRGVRDVKLSAGDPVGVSYRVGDEVREVAAGLVVGADGRASTVGKQAGVSLEREEPFTWVAGLLLDGLHDVPDDHDVMVSEGDLLHLLLHQGGGRARAYAAVGLSGKQRFSGREATTRFLEAWHLSSYPHAAAVAAATPAGPCATYPGDDTWTAAPYSDGVVLIGDAAGHNDPIVGQGLSIAMRDARLVGDLVLEGARTPAQLRPYGEERVERMRRLRLVADVLAVVHAEDADNRRARRRWFGRRMATMDPEVFPLVIGAFAGPETIPPDVVDPGILDRIRGA
ncbi:MAG: FAD-dependent monooxygenase [Acidimicrobiales bacterium]